MSRAKDAARQREIIARLEAEGGKRMAFSLPADVIDILGGVSDLTQSTQTKALIFLLRKSAEINPKVAEAAAAHKAKREAQA